MGVSARLPSGPESCSETPQRRASHHATRRLAACNAQAFHNSDVARQSAPDNNAPLFREVLLPALIETRRATTPVLDRSSIFRSGAAALPRKPLDARSSFDAAIASA